MEHRLNPYKASPKGYQAMAALEHFVMSCGIERPLLELVKMRASQINGCAYCLDMHSKDARALGETEQRLYLLNAWRESPFLYRTRASGARMDRGDHPYRRERRPRRSVYERVAKQFSPEELANLTLAIATINSWNRLSIPFRIVPGSYKSNLQPLKANA